MLIWLDMVEQEHLSQARIRYDQSTGTTAVVITNGVQADDSSERTTQAVEEILETMLAS